MCLLFTQLSITIQHLLTFSIRSVMSWVAELASMYVRVHHHYGSIIWSSQVATEWYVGLRTNLLWNVWSLIEARFWDVAFGEWVGGVYVTRQVWGLAWSSRLSGHWVMKCLLVIIGRSRVDTVHECHCDRQAHRRCYCHSIRALWWRRKNRVKIVWKHQWLANVLTVGRLQSVPMKQHADLLPGLEKPSF